MLRLTWRLFVLLTLSASCAVGWVWKHRASRSQSIYVRGFGRYCVVVSTPSGVLAVRVNGDPAARPGEAWYGYTAAGASDAPARQIQGGPAVFDLVPARESVHGPLVVSAGIAESTVPPPALAPDQSGPGIAATEALLLLHRRAVGPARPVFTYDAWCMPHGLAAAALALPAAAHIMLFWRGLRVRAQRIRVECAPSESDRRREKSRHCQACGAKVD